MRKSRTNGRVQVTLHIAEGGLLARLLADWQREYEITSTNRAMYTLLMESLIDYMRAREGDDPALYDMLYNEWLGTLSMDDKVSFDDFVDWLVAREMPPAGGKREGAGRPRKQADEN